MRRFVYRLLIMTFILPVSLFAQDVKTLSLKEAVDYALRNNVSVKNAELDVLIQQAQNAQVTANAYPRVSGKGDFTDYVNKPVTFFPSEFGRFIDTSAPVVPGTFVPVSLVPKYSSNATISGSQILFDGSVLVALQARNTILELARKNGQLTRENLAYNVTRAYYALVIAYRQFAILNGTLNSFREIAHDIQALHNAGFAEKIEVDRSHVQINNLVADSIRVGNLLNVSEQLLKYQMGMNINQPIILTDTAIESITNNYGDLLDKATDYNNRTELGLLYTQQRLNEYNLKRYRFAALPTLSLFGNLGYTYASDIFSEMLKFRRNYVFTSLYGLTLNVPIFSGFQRTNQVREAKLNIEKTQNNIENMKLTIDFQTAQSRTTLRNSLLQLESQQRNVALAGSVLDLAKRKYKEGVGSNLEVTQAQTDMLQAQNNYFQSLLEVVNAQTDLQKALGQLSY